MYLLNISRIARLDFFGLIVFLDDTLAWLIKGRIELFSA